MILAGFRYKFFQLGKRPQRIASISGLTPHRLRALPEGPGGVSKASTSASFRGPLFYRRSARAPLLAQRTPIPGLPPGQTRRGCRYRNRDACLPGGRAKDGHLPYVVAAANFADLFRWDVDAGGKSHRTKTRANVSGRGSRGFGKYDRAAPVSRGRMPR